jgi:hypothetical protein
MRNVMHYGMIDIIHVMHKIILEKIQAPFPESGDSFPLVLVHPLPRVF